MEKPRKKKESISGLKADLRCANAEAGDYLSSVRNLQDSVKNMKVRLEAAENTMKAAESTIDWQNRVIAVLILALERANQK